MIVAEAHCASPADLERKLEVNVDMEKAGRRRVRDDKEE